MRQSFSSALPSSGGLAGAAVALRAVTKAYGTGTGR